MSSYVTDDYFLVLAEMCGDGEVITEINAAPSNGGWAGLELREDTTSSARKFGLRTQTGAFVQVFRRDTPGQAAAAYSFVKPTHKWLKINRYGSYFTASTSYDGNNWITVYATALSLANCIKAGVYTQSAYAGTPSSALFNQVSISDSSPVTEVNFADSTLTASPGDSIQICVEVANSCECAPASVDVALTSSSSPHLAGYTTQNLAFTDSSTQQCFTIVLADTAATASYTFSLQNVSGGNNGQVGSVPNLSLSVVDSSMASDFFCGIIPPIGYDFFTEAKVHDRFGNIYDFAQIKIPISNYNPSSRLVNNGPIPPGFENCSCQDLGINTGNFNLWFEDCDLETGTGFDDPVVGQDRRRVMCTVFEYLSATILPNPSQCSDSIPIVNVKVQPSDAITNNGYYGSNLPAMPSSRGAAASACYFDNIGIVHGDPWIIINSGAYPPHTAIDEYHGLMRVNFSEGSNIDWHLGLAAGPNDPMNPRTDLYSVCLHEALHMLDFASSFNVGNNNLNDNSYLEGGYFAFDRFMRLVDDFGAPLSNSEPVIINDPGPSLFWHFNPSINVPNDFTVGCNDPNTGPDLVFEGANGNYPLLFGNAFVSGVSFSHLATVCDGAAIAPLVMQTNWGANDTRRTIMPPEEDILTQIGYSLNGIDSCSVGGVSNIGPPCTDSIYRIGLCTPGVIYIPIDDLIEDGPNADSIAFIHLLNPIAGDGEVIDSNGILYFRFIPSRLGRVEFIYVPVGCNGQWGNNTRLFIEVFADDSCAGFCPSPVSCNEGYFDGLICTEYHSCGTLLSKNACNLICNPEICATAYRAQFVNNLIWPLTNSNIDQTFIDIPGWYVSHSTPDFIPDDSVFPGSGYLRMFTSSGVTADYSEGVFSFVDFSPENNYFLTLYAGVAPVFETTLDDTTSLIINLVNSNQIIYDPITPVVDGPSQEVIDWVPPDSLLGSPDSLRLARIGTCFSPDSTIFNAIRFYIEPFGAGNFGRLDLAIDNIEIVEDNFYAGDDKTVSCGNQVLLGGQFCMASDVEVTYQWMVDGQIIAEYEVLNGDITINMGNIDTATHELILFPTASDTFTLYRQFTDLGGLPPSFIPCNSTDTVAITVLQGIPTADFSYLADESDCSVSFESLQQGTHSWDFGDGETDTTSMPVHNYDVENIDTFLVIHTLANDCGTNSDTAQIIIDCCDSPTLTINSTHDGCGNVDFSVTATGNNPTLVAYNWDFGDGATDTSATPGHTYAGEGTYIVSLTATNDCGEQASATDTLIIDFPDAPDATFTISIDTCSRTVNFTSAPGQEANYHRWEFGDAAN
ncbi:MAG: PKD domain-containing protein, partial [Phaeodactylibacter sp.]|nr:PKD domain-containing protein [Phaeodactylibacter sp.]